MWGLFNFIIRPVFLLFFAPSSETKTRTIVQKTGPTDAPSLSGKSHKKMDRTHKRGVPSFFVNALPCCFRPLRQPQRQHGLPTGAPLSPGERGKTNPPPPSSPPSEFRVHPPLPPREFGVQPRHPDENVKVQCLQGNHKQTTIKRMPHNRETSRDINLCGVRPVGEAANSAGPAKRDADTFTAPIHARYGGLHINV